MKRWSCCAPVWVLTLVALCAAALSSCAGHDACSDDDCDDSDAVGAYGTTDGTISSSAILSANGSYGPGCRLHPNGAWSVAMTNGAPLDNAALEVAKTNTACTLSLVSLRTGSGASNLYTASSPLVLTASYGAGALFTSPQGSFTGNAKLSTLAFTSSFVLMLLVSQDVQTGTAAATTYYAYDSRVLADIPLSYWRLDDSAPTPFATDDFAGTAGALLQSRMGAPTSWSKHSASGTDAILSSAGRVRVGTAKKAVYLAATTPASADYAVSADVFVASLLANDQAGVIGRATSPAETYYFAGLVETYAFFVQTRRLELWKSVNGFRFLLGSWDDSALAGSTHRVSLEMRGTSIRASLDGVERLVVTDTSITAAGSAGILLGVNSGSSQSESAGLHLDNPSVRNVLEARDSKGTNHGLYASGVTQGAAGALKVVNAAATFDGTNDYVEVAREIGNDFSIELWFTSTQGLGAPTATQWHQTAGLVDAGASLSTGDFGIGLRSDGRILAGTGKTTCLVAVLCGDDDQNLISSGATAYNDGVWHHVVFTRGKASGSMALYVDGVSKGVLASGGATHTLDASASLGIGRLQTGTNYFAGSIDEVAVYGTVLGAQAVLNHYRAGKHL